MHGFVERSSGAACCLMAIGITHLGSGSRGNATIFTSGECNVMVDCGFSLKQTEKRLGVAGFDPESIDSIIVTHHHKDHSGSALRASKKWGSKLHCNLGTATKMGWDLASQKNFAYKTFQKIGWKIMTILNLLVLQMTQIIVVFVQVVVLTI